MTIFVPAPHQSRHATRVPPLLEARPRTAPPPLPSACGIEVCDLKGVQLRVNVNAPTALRRVSPLVFTLALVTAVIVGWSARDEGHLTPENGTGYWLGVAGGSAMLLLLLYPLRKRVKWMRALGSVVFWFRLHMILGAVGPILIFYHANFKLGSANSTVALVAMLLVAGSGVAGRYLYGRVHHGLYGRKAEVTSLLENAQTLLTKLGYDLPAAEHLIAELTHFSTQAMRPASTAVGSAMAVIFLGWRARRCRRRVMAEATRFISNEGKLLGWSRKLRRSRLQSVRQLLAAYFVSIRKAAAFAFFERLFSLWHVLHLPLFMLLIVAATLHVVAVHIY